MNVLKKLIIPMLLLQNYVIAEPVISLLDYHSSNGNLVCESKAKAVRKSLNIEFTSEQVSSQKYKLETEYGDLIIICDGDYIFTAIASKQSISVNLMKIIKKLKTN